MLSNKSNTKMLALAVLSGATDFCKHHFWCWEIIWWKLGQERRKICTFAEYNLSANKKIIIIWNG